MSTLPPDKFISVVRGHPRPTIPIVLVVQTAANLAANTTQTLSLTPRPGGGNGTSRQAVYAWTYDLERIEPDSSLMR